MMGRKLQRWGLLAVPMLLLMGASVSFGQDVIPLTQPVPMQEEEWVDLDGEGGVISRFDITISCCFGPRETKAKPDRLDQLIANLEKQPAANPNGPAIAQKRGGVRQAQYQAVIDELKKRIDALDQNRPAKTKRQVVADVKKAANNVPVVIHIAARAQEDEPVAEAVEEVQEVPVQRPIPQIRPAATQPSTPSSKPVDSKKKAKLDPKSLDGLKKRYHEVQTQIARLKKQPAPPKPDDKKLIVVLEDPHLSQGQYRSNNNYDRSFVVQMLLANPTKQDLQIKRSEVTLHSDNKTYKAADRLSRYHDSYRVNGEYLHLSNLKMPEVIKVPAGKTASAWAVFPALPTNPTIPDLKLVLNIEGKTAESKEKREINVNEFCQTLLRTQIERLGPRNCLALITLGGKLNPINVRDLVDELDELAVNQKVARVIIRWEKDAASVESNLMNWLQNAANQAGQVRPQNNNNYAPYPVVPISIRELHLAERHKDNGGSSSSGLRIHKSVDEAIISALRTAYLALSTNEIVDDLRHKNPTIRAAALMGGGGRLPPDKLPVLLEFVNSSDRNLQRAAIFAMRNFGEANAINTLVELIKKNEKPKCTEAAESLAISRFGTASKALLDLLETAEPAVKTNIVQVLAKYPRPIWADAIAEYAEHPETGIGMASLRALNGIGHPRLLALLKHALNQKTESIQTEAFNMLAARKDQASEDLALEYTLKHLRTKPLIGNMSNLLTRTKDPRAIPLLMRHFQTKTGSRSTVINVLGQIGDQTVVDVLVSEYPKMSNQDKRYVLQGLQQLHSPEFVRLAEGALLIKDSSLVRMAAKGLYQEGSPRAEKMLIDSLKKNVKHSYWSYICSELMNFGTPQARAALRQARSSKDSNKKSAAINALRNMQQRSPGNQYVYQANNYVKQEKWDLALRYFNLCLEADPEYAAAYAGRGNIYVRQKKYKNAKTDFERAIKADPENNQAHAGLAILTIIDGRVDEGVEYMQAERKKFEQYSSNKSMMLYNIACVYGRAVEELNKNAEDANQAQKQKDYQSKAIKELQAAVKNGFNNFDLMKKDPDLQALAKLPEFQKLLPKPNKKRVKPNLNAAPGQVQGGGIGFF